MRMITIYSRGKLHSYTFDMYSGGGKRELTIRSEDAKSFASYAFNSFDEDAARKLHDWLEEAYPEFKNNEYRVERRASTADRRRRGDRRSGLTRRDRLSRGFYQRTDVGRRVTTSKRRKAADRRTS